MTRRHDWNHVSRGRAVCRACGVERDRHPTTWPALVGYTTTPNRAGVPTVTFYRGGYCGPLVNPRRPPPCIVPMRHGPLTPWRAELLEAGRAGVAIAAAVGAGLADFLERAGQRGYRTPTGVGEGAR